jgi:hypothetical protein
MLFHSSSKFEERRQFLVEATTELRNAVKQFFSLVCFDSNEIP